jgi:RNA polymerase sigma-70 factor, ECF subfamily
MPSTATTPVSPEEPQLLDRLRAGESAAFETLVRRYGGHMLASARLLLGRQDDSCGAVRDAFQMAYQGLEQFEGQLGTWLQHFLLTAALTRLRAASDHAKRSIDELLPHFSESGRLSKPAREWPPPALEALNQPEAMAQELLEQLPEAYRAVLWLHDMEGLDTEAAAQLLELNNTVVKTRLHRARQALRGLLDAHVRQGAS